MRFDRLRNSRLLDSKETAFRRPIFLVSLCYVLASMIVYGLLKRVNSRHEQSIRIEDDRHFFSMIPVKLGGVASRRSRLNATLQPKRDGRFGQSILMGDSAGSLMARRQDWDIRVCFMGRIAPLRFASMSICGFHS